MFLYVCVCVYVFSVSKSVCAYCTNVKVYLSCILPCQSVSEEVPWDS